MDNKNNTSSSYTKYHKAYNETKQTRKFTMELSHIEHYSLHEYAKFKKMPIKALLLQALEKIMFNDIDFISFLVQAGNLSKSMTELYQTERKRLNDRQKAREEQARKEELERLKDEEVKRHEAEKLKLEELENNGTEGVKEIKKAEQQEEIRIKEMQGARAKEIQVKILNLKSRTKVSEEIEIPVTAEKNEHKNPPVKNHRMKFLSGITPAEPKKVIKPEKIIATKVKPVKVPEQMSILEEVAKATEKEKVKPEQGKQPNNKLKNSKQGKPDDKQEFGPGSKGVSKNVTRKPAKTGEKVKTKKRG